MRRYSCPHYLDCLDAISRTNRRWTSCGDCKRYLEPSKVGVVGNDQGDRKVRVAPPIMKTTHRGDKPSPRSEGTGTVDDKCGCAVAVRTFQPDKSAMAAVTMSDLAGGITSNGQGNRALVSVSSGEQMSPVKGNHPVAGSTPAPAHSTKGGGAHVRSRNVVSQAVVMPATETTTREGVNHVDSVGDRTRAGAGQPGPAFVRAFRDSDGTPLAEYRCECGRTFLRHASHNNYKRCKQCATERKRVYMRSYMKKWAAANPQYWKERERDKAKGCVGEK